MRILNVGGDSDESLIQYIYIHRNMGTKTVSLSDDAYERLAAEKRESESFSDVVRRLTEGVDLSDFRGVLSDETADKIEEHVAQSRGSQVGAVNK